MGEKRTEKTLEAAHLSSQSSFSNTPSKNDRKKGGGGRTPTSSRWPHAKSHFNCPVQEGPKRRGGKDDEDSLLHASQSLPLLGQSN